MKINEYMNRNYEDINNLWSLQNVKAQFHVMMDANWYDASI
jgi:hypothetical protein